MSNVVRLDDHRARRGTPTPRVVAQLAAGQRLLTPDELARELRVSTRTIRRDRRAGMPSIPVGQRDVRYVLADVLEWHAQRRAAQRRGAA